MKKLVLVIASMAISLFTAAQEKPCLFFSKNTVVSVVQDQMVKFLRGKLPSDQMLVLAPSYCYIDSLKANFIQVVSSSEVDYEKIRLTSYCGDAAGLGKLLTDAGIREYLIVSGQIQRKGGRLETSVVAGLGSTAQLADTAKKYFQGTLVDTLSMDKLRLKYEFLDLDGTAPYTAFAQDGICVAMDRKDFLLMSAIDRKQLNIELQSTGVTSVAIYLPIGFANEKLRAKSFPYNDNKGNELLINGLSFVKGQGELKFQFGLQGTRFLGKPMVNSYQAELFFDQQFRLLRSRASVVIERETSESNRMRSKVVTFSNAFRGSLLFGLTADKAFAVQTGTKSINLSMDTYYGHVVGACILLVNSFKVKP